MGADAGQADRAPRATPNRLNAFGALLLVAVSNVHAAVEQAAVPDALLELPQAHRFVESVQFEQGGVVLWEYFERPSTRNEPHPLRSAGKSVLSATVGAVAGERAAAVIETPVWAAFGKLLPAAPDERRQRLTFEHVITMRSGHACLPLGAPRNPCDPLDAGSRDPWKAFLLAPMRDEPGTHFVYSDGAPHVIAALLVLLEASDAQRIVREKLLAPLGMDRRAGMERMSPANMRSFGELMLQQGCWRGRQLIPREWVARSTRSHVRFAAPRANMGYGYFWWTRSVPADARRIELYYAAGSGGQLVVVVPALDALIVTTGTAWERPDALGGLIDTVTLEVVPALREPHEPDAHARCLAELAD